GSAAPRRGLERLPPRPRPGRELAFQRQVTTSVETASGAGGGGRGFGRPAPLLRAYSPTIRGRLAAHPPGSRGGGAMQAGLAPSRRNPPLPGKRPGGRPVASGAGKLTRPGHCGGAPERPRRGGGRNVQQVSPGGARDAVPGRGTARRKPRSLP